MTSTDAGVNSVPIASLSREIRFALFIQKHVDSLPQPSDCFAYSPNHLRNQYDCHGFSAHRQTGANITKRHRSIFRYISPRMSFCYPCRVFGIPLPAVYPLPTIYDESPAASATVTDNVNITTMAVLAQDDGPEPSWYGQMNYMRLDPQKWNPAYINPDPPFHIIS